MTSDSRNILMKAFMRNLLACVALALVFAFLGIYDSDNMALPSRIVFWTVIMCMGGLMVAVAEPLVFGRLLRGAHPVLQLGVISVILSVPITIILGGLNTGFQFNFSAVNWVLQFLNVMVISVIVVCGRYLVSQFINRVSHSGLPKERAQNPIDNFLKRQPLKFHNAELYGLSSEGHYLRMHTDKGSTLILMRISDAVRELEQADGLQVHRSWWVARNGIKDSTRKNGQRFLILKDGTTAPVSRSFLPKLKEAGLDR